jgi:hypothetical protein
MSITFNITDWNAWTPGLSSQADWRKWAQNSTRLSPNCDTEDKPDVSEIPPMLRRRLTAQGKAALSVMLPLHNKYGPMPIIYVSRHGEAARTVTMLTDIANKELLSPTQFSLSVHNATAGLFSIQQKVTDNIVAIAAGDNDVIPALLEAIGQFDDRTSNALVVFCDEPLPELYRHQVPSPTALFAAAFIISSGEGFELKHTQSNSLQASSLVQALELVAFAAGDGDNLILSCNNSDWLVSRV